MNLSPGISKKMCRLDMPWQRKQQTKHESNAPLKMRILLNFSDKNYRKNLFYQSSFADAATQTDVSGFSVNGHENSIGELNETVEKLSRELKQLQCQLLEGAVVAQLASVRLSEREVAGSIFSDFSVCFDFPLIRVAIALNTRKTEQ